MDELSSRKGHEYLSVFADLVAWRVVFANEGKDHVVFERFAEELFKHNGHPKALEPKTRSWASAGRSRGGLREPFEGGIGGLTRKQAQKVALGFQLRRSSRQPRPQPLVAAF